MPTRFQLFDAKTEEYAAATRPHNSSGSQRPAFAARPRSAHEVAAVVVEAARRGLHVVPQATGHGAGGDLDDSTILVDTSLLDDLTIAPDRRTMSSGAGVTWGRVNAAAEQHGLLGLAGSAPTVSVSGFTFGGGIGWLTRPHGMTSSALRRVEYVAGDGSIRIAAEDAEQTLDRDALWAFRGGGGVGIATRLELDLVAVPDLHAGYLLWPIDALEPVVAAWAASMDQVGPHVASSIAVLHAPPAPPFPDALHGKPVVHLAIASSTGEAEARVLLDAVRAAARPTVDTWGAADAATLAGIHLDPPGATPALGDARWLTAATPQVAEAVLATAAAPDAAIAMIEIRHVGNDAPSRDGAQTAIPGPFILHAVGALTAPDMRPRIAAGFDEARRAAAAADTGRAVGSWMEGATSVPDALPTAVRSRVVATADAVDPNHRIARSRFLN